MLAAVHYFKWRPDMLDGAVDKAGAADLRCGAEPQDQVMGSRRSRSASAAAKAMGT
ncbi:hypothetical protein [Actinomadura rugatobispora]|uniref:Uncharacterized protein n=1 Tax=Actinomadura rugatobispora TaxID=1994 RepID=A0ABW0ZW10_9ACTN|nr:hypothetical protein GCM10010200_090330 [Actinomadura rugatobispora]